MVNVKSKQLTFNVDDEKPKPLARVKFSPFIDHNGVGVNATETTK